MKILITGGSSGLGKAVVSKAAKNKDCFIYFTYRSNVEGAKQIEQQFPNTKGFFCDFGDEASVNALCDEIVAMDLDVLINNAYSGSTFGNYFYKTDVEEFENAFRLNVLPLIKITQATIKCFRKKKSGKIITILSAAIIGVPPMGYSVYAATKAYIAQLVKQWSKEYIQYGITSNAVSPDFMLTELTNDVNEKYVEQILEKSNLKRPLLPEEVAEIIVDMCSATTYVNGANIPVNAGANI